MSGWLIRVHYSLALFFLIVSVGAHYSCLGHGKMHFAMTWYSFVFPNTGLTVRPSFFSRERHSASKPSETFETFD